MFRFTRTLAGAARREYFDPRTCKRQSVMTVEMTPKIDFLLSKVEAGRASSLRLDELNREMCLVFQGVRPREFRTTLHFAATSGRFTVLRAA